MKTYNFIEASNSGKRFRPFGQGYGWYSFHDDGKFKVPISNDDPLSDFDFFTGQFEIEDMIIEINESMFDKALEEFMDDQCVFTENLKQFKKRLGFSD